MSLTTGEGVFKTILSEYLLLLKKGRNRTQAVLSLAEKYRNDPWLVVGPIGLLARCAVVPAPAQMGLNAALQPRKPHGRAALVTLEKGQPYPAPKNQTRSKKGAFDTPRALADRVANAAISSCVREPVVGFDPACGTGALLLALHERGIPSLYGSDIDELALALAKIAIPSGQFTLCDAFLSEFQADVVVGNPPFVSVEKQQSEFRRSVRKQYPWLTGRFDLSLPFAQLAVDCCRPMGGVGLILPDALLTQRYAVPLRKDWISSHQITELTASLPFPTASVNVCVLALTKQKGPSRVPPSNIEPDVLKRLPMCPLGSSITARDVVLVEKIRSRSESLGSFCLVDTGVVAHQSGGSREHLLWDHPGNGRVPYADAKEFFKGQRRWLQYEPERMHRAKNPDTFLRPKIVIQRIRGHHGIKAAVCRDGVFVGHTCTVVQPNETAVPLDALLQLIQSPVVHWVLETERGTASDLYPSAVSAFPVPRQWLENPAINVMDAFGLTDEEREYITHTLG